ncbi:hypothetical protein PRIPAC_83330 [Pristionchus pacificus]|uniref:Uncharacterized protein n=1 Tax=Pristionchus pacificus TaxID=54126 RepID=A0A2A6BV08_PRIPA|nr:hypothetical protein PRIPAC_83330 [Pristionchus pacificus]|eukprot:PDM69633.1 hypothetical protein PRIPAC_44729 [Pristionchus pacificus]
MSSITGRSVLSSICCAFWENSGREEAEPIKFQRSVSHLDGLEDDDDLRGVRDRLLDRCIHGSETEKGERAELLLELGPEQAQLEQDVKQTVESEEGEDQRSITLIHRLSSASESADCHRRICNGIIRCCVITSEFERLQCLGGHFHAVHLEDLPATVQVGEVLLERIIPNLNVDLRNVDHVVGVEPADEFGELLGFLEEIKDQSTNYKLQSPKIRLQSTEFKVKTTNYKDHTLTLSWVTLRSLAYRTNCETYVMMERRSGRREIMSSTWTVLSVNVVRYRIEQSVTPISMRSVRRSNLDEPAHAQLPEGGLEREFDVLPRQFVRARTHLRIRSRIYRTRPLPYLGVRWESFVVRLLMGEVKGDERCVKTISTRTANVYAKPYSTRQFMDDLPYQSQDYVRIAVGQIRSVIVDQLEPATTEHSEGLKERNDL